MDDALDGLEDFRDEQTAVDIVPRHTRDTALTERPPKPPPKQQAKRPKAPPPRKTAKIDAPFAGRTDFPKLFAPEPGPPKADPAGGLDAKVDFLRSSLKKAENRLAKVRNAWDIRSTEMDALEADLEQAKKNACTQEEKTTELVTALARSRQQAEDQQQKIEALEDFIRQKKVEFDNYAAKVQGAFVEQDRVVKIMRAKLEEMEQRHQEEDEDEIEAEVIDTFGESMDALDEVVRQRNVMISHLQQELDLKDSESERLMMALRAERAKQLEAEPSASSDASRMQMALRAETGKVTSLQEKVETLERLVSRLRRALRAERAKSDEIEAEAEEE